MQIWDWRKAERLLGPVPMPAEPRGVAFHGGEDWVAVLCAGGEVLRVNVADGKIDPLFKTAGPVPPGEFERGGALRFEAGSEILVVSAARSLHLWNVALNRLVAPPIHLEDVMSGWDAHGDLLVVAVNSSKVRILNLRTGNLAAPPLESLSQTRKAWLMSEGRLCLTQTRDGVRLRDWRSGAVLSREMSELPSDASPIPGTPFCITSSQLEARKATRIEIWNPLDGRMVAPPIEVENFTEFQVKVSPSGRHAVLFGYWKSVAIDLQRELNPPTSELDDDDRLQLAELNACARIEAGAPVKLTEAEWRERWESFRRRHPAHHAWR